MNDKDRRRQSRQPAEVKVDYRTVGSFITDYSANISKGGVFVRTSIPLNIGDRVRLRVTLPGYALPFGIDGVVRWVSPAAEDGSGDPGMGIEFVQFSDDLRERLQSFVDDLDHRDGT